MKRLSMDSLTKYDRSKHENLSLFCRAFGWLYLRFVLYLEGMEEADEGDDFTQNGEADDMRSH